MPPGPAPTTAILLGALFAPFLIVTTATVAQYIYWAYRGSSTYELWTSNKGLIELYPSSLILLISLVPVLGHLFAIVILSTIPLGKIIDKILSIISSMDPFTWIMKLLARKIINKNLTSINKKYQDKILLDKEEPDFTPDDESKIKSLEVKLASIRK